jgi:secondary thiamine-phosphate synthase enzyme
MDSIENVKAGMLHLLLQHTSASLSLNENADPSVREDCLNFFNNLVPENLSYYTHTMEGSDDMPAHIKSMVLGVELNIPITNGRLALGMWQGIYLGEHRNNASDRDIIATLIY